MEITNWVPKQIVTIWEQSLSVQCGKREPDFLDIFDTEIVVRGDEWKNIFERLLVDEKMQWIWVSMKQYGLKPGWLLSMVMSSTRLPKDEEVRSPPEYEQWVLEVKQLAGELSSLVKGSGYNSSFYWRLNGLPGYQPISQVLEHLQVEFEGDKQLIREVPYLDSQDLSASQEYFARNLLSIFSHVPHIRKPRSELVAALTNVVFPDAEVSKEDVMKLINNDEMDTAI